MKKILFFITALAAASIWFTACDKVEPDNRLIYVEPTQVSRAVLIEDFTGQRCVNCPKASEEIEQLQAEYGDSIVIAVAIHSGPFGKTVKGEPTPLYTATGDEYFNAWGVDAQPIGAIDRLGAFEYTDWQAGVKYELAKEAPVSILIDNAYDEATATTDIDIQLIGLDSTGVTGKLQVWLIEDSIVDYQYMPDGSVNDNYMHMHVFRTSVNDTWGDNITVAHGDVKTMAYSQQLDAAWIPRHCSIIAFVYDDTGVKQVAKAKIINN